MTLHSRFAYDLVLPYTETHFQTPVITFYLLLNVLISLIILIISN